MKLWSIFILAGIILAGCINLPGPSGGVVDCGSDKQCFQTHMKQCDPAKISASSGGLFDSLAGQNSGVDISAYAEVKSGTPKACKVYMRIDHMSMPGLPSEVANQINGKDMTCTIDATKANPQPDPSTCSGSLVDVLQSASG